MSRQAYLILENGKVFSGEAFGAVGEVTAEVVFTTGMSGYLETLTEKSFFGQIVVQTFPMIGNYGIIPEDLESDTVGVSGYIVKEWCMQPSNFRAESDLDAFLKARGVVGLCGIDTRALTKCIRENGVMNGMITDDPKKADLEKLKAYRVKNAVELMGAKETVRFENPQKKFSIALIDYGMRKSLREKLERFGAEVTVCPYNITADELKALEPDGVVLSDGPGDPREVPALVENLKAILKLNIPVLGVALGYELLALANGFEVRKMKYGHRGANQPVKDLETGRVCVTSQNHGYEVVTSSIESEKAELYFENVNDKTCEGIRYKNVPAFSVQFMPDASRGSADTTYVFDIFFRMMEKC